MTTESADTAGPGPLLAAGHAAPATFPPPRSSGRPPARAGRPGTRARSRTGRALRVADCLTGVAAAAVFALAGTAATPPAVPALALPLALTLNARAGLYRPGPRAAAADTLPALLARLGAAWGLAAAAWAGLSPGRPLALGELLAVVATHLLLATAARGLVLAARRRRARRKPHATLLVGPGPAGRRLAAALREHPEYGLRPVAVVGDAGEGDGAAPALPVLATAEDVERAVARHAVRDAVFAAAPQSDPRLSALAGLLTAEGCTLWIADDTPGATPPDTHLWGHGCRRLDPPPSGLPGALAKRLLDVVLATVALLLAAPVLLACAAAVRLADGPGVIFRQERVGQDGRPFTLLKFRTLRPADAYESATLWSVADDRRMSRAGRLLRRTSLDELPQLWNVLRGDMSLVGPRPERPYFVARFSEAHPGYAARHRMPAGITGLAQVHGLRGDTSIEDRARFDNHYIASWTLWQDVRILLRTATLLFRHTGS
ncbi:exopolysaccharide biosynthesis polyprenyl glycosylphosphotransferase [Streptomyces sp. TRM70308]|uniref:exopolysaccharide biosynthesis polyprenyl glycosylphosphotransferase n=1 Tax=Streptomyces sp. TRM70308 TaxID=3131932 RepID=UPI003D088EB0